MSEEKIKKKLNGQLFFLVGPNFSSSEESSTVKYSECALDVGTPTVPYMVKSKRLVKACISL